MKLWSCLPLVICLYSSVLAGTPEAPATANRVRVVFKATKTDHMLLIIPFHYSVDSSETGELAGWSADSLALNLDHPKGSRRAVATSHVTRFYVADGKQRAFLSGAKWGTIAALPMAMLFAFGVPETESSRLYSVGDRAVASVTILGMGAAVGFVIGSLCKEDRWREVKRADWPIGVQVSCGPGGPILSLRCRF